MSADIKIVIIIICEINNCGYKKDIIIMIEIITVLITKNLYIIISN